MSGSGGDPTAEAGVETALAAAAATSKTGGDRGAGASSPLAVDSCKLVPLLLSMAPVDAVAVSYFGLHGRQGARQEAHVS